VGRHVSKRNAAIIEQRAAGWSIPKIALEHDISLARVGKILSDHRKDVRIAELELEVGRLARIIAGPLPSPLAEYAKGLPDDVRIARGHKF
jgi:hypothetical protein